MAKCSSEGRPEKSEQWARSHSWGGRRPIVGRHQSLTALGYARMRGAANRGGARWSLLTRGVPRRQFAAPRPKLAPRGACDGPTEPRIATRMGPAVQHWDIARRLARSASGARGGLTARRIAPPPRSTNGQAPWWACPRLLASDRTWAGCGVWRSGVELRGWEPGEPGPARRVRGLEMQSKLCEPDSGRILGGPPLGLRPSCPPPPRPSP